MSLLRTASLLFALVMTVVWGTSYVRPIVLRMARTPQEVWFLDADHGRIRLTHQRVNPTVVMGLTTDADTLHTITMRDARGAVVTSSRDAAYRDAKSPWWFDENAGNHVMNLTRTPAGTVNLTMRFVCVPMWVLIALALLPVGVRRVRAWRARRQWSLKGLCPACGYDLRGTPQQCPECGTVPPVKEAAAT